MKSKDDDWVIETDDGLGDRNWKISMGNNDYCVDDPTAALIHAAFLVKNQIEDLVFEVAVCSKGMEKDEE